MRVNSLIKKLSALAVTGALAVSMIPSIVATQPVLAAEGQTPVEKYGAIKVVGTQLCDENGNPIQLRGMSTFGLQWDDGAWILNDDAFDVLADDWNCDIVRLAMYVGENGYHDKPELLLDRVEQGIQLATQRGMYVLVDWHILNGDTHNPASEYCMEAGENLEAFAEIKAAHPDYRGPQLFFAYLSAKYGAQPNVLFETANEPNSNGGASSWESVLYDYHDSVINAIRDNDADQVENIIICGTEQWSQLVDAPIAKPLPYSNIMYTMHFYAGTHDLPDKDPYIMAMVDNALANGIPVFCTEWGTSEATGDGGPYINYSERWLDFLADRGISWCSWSLAQKNEISAACLNTTPVHPVDNDGDGIKDWTPEELSITGNYVRAMIRGEEAPLYKTSQPLFDFEDASQFGSVGRASDNTNTDVTVSSATIGDNTVAQIDGLNTAANPWGNNDGRIALSLSNVVYGIYKTLDLDVIVATEDAGNSVEVIPVLQDAVRQAWWMQAGDIKVTSFEDCGNGYSIAHVSFSLDSVIENPKDAATNLILIIGADNTVYIDNVEFLTVGNGDISTQPKIPDEPGTFQGLPFDFEEGGRQGWKPEGTSTATTNYTKITTVEITDGNHAMVMPFAPTDNEWETGVRMSSPMGIMSYAESTAVNTFLMDLYLEAGAATTGSVKLAIMSIPNGDGYWYQSGEFEAVIGAGEAVPGTNLVHYSVSVPLNNTGADEYPFSENVAIRNIVIACHNADSDYNGNVYYDNIRYEYVEPVDEPIDEPIDEPVDEPIDEPVDEPTMTPAEAFVTNLYESLFDRTPDAAGLAFWTNLIDKKIATPEDVIRGFFNSSEYKVLDTDNATFVEDLYEAILGREAEAGGASFWSNRLAAGTTRDDLINGFIASPEYTGLEKTPANTVEGFVADLYTDVLGREADAEGFAFWTNLLKTGKATPAEVVLAFFESAEYKSLDRTDAQFVSDLYAGVLGRSADAEGAAFWAKVLSNGTSRIDVINGFLGSEEFEVVVENISL